jgi:hypothetical protein
MDEDPELSEPEDPVSHENDRLAALYPSDSGDAWLVGVAPGGFGVSPLMREPKGSTPLESAQCDDLVPSSPLWAMKYLRHGRFGLSHDDEFEQIRWASGPASPASPDDRDAEIFVIDDGSDHCMVSRLVGESPDGCTYCLVARVKRLDFEDVRSGQAEAVDLFSRGKELTLCGVVEGAVSNVIRVAGYRRYRDVPADYRPPAGLIEFDGPL